MTRPSRLFALCTSKRWSDVLELIRSNPNEAKSLQSTGKRGAAPISVLQIVLAHARCRGDVPLCVVEALLETAPRMASQRHLYTGNLPLHAVFYNPFYSASKRTQIAEKIMAACPESVMMKNKDERTPLHTICSQHCNQEPILALLKAAPQTASWTDKNGDLPIHLACRSLKSPNKSIRALFDAFPGGLWEKNGSGLTPLDIARLHHSMSAKHESRIDLLEKLKRCASKKRHQSSVMMKEDTTDSDCSSDCLECVLSVEESQLLTNNMLDLTAKHDKAQSAGLEELSRSCDKRVVTYMELNSPLILLSMRLDEKHRVISQTVNNGSLHQGLLA